MATRMIRFGRWSLLAAVAMLVAVGCTSLDRPSVVPDRVALPTPLSSFDASMSATIGQLQRAAATAESRLVVPSNAYRPSEPQSLLQTPRVVMRADLADPDDGYLVIYDAGSAGSASQRAQELADYLGSGFGQTNFVADTQFSVGVVGDTVVFTTWSRRRSADPTKAEAVFDAIAGVGQAFEVRK
jgi:hypothetical protein